MLLSLESKEQMEHAIGTLRGYASITERGEGETPDIHSLMHLVTRMWFERQDLVEQAAHDAAQHLRVSSIQDRTNRII